MKVISEEVFCEINDSIILNSPNIVDLGILHGKMGVVIYLYIYSRYSQKEYYADFASILLDGILSELDVSLSFSFESGLSGIGWGIEYLIQNKYLDGDTSEILSDIDLIVMKNQDIRRINDWSFKKGISGLVLYTFTRLTSFARNQNKYPFDELYLSEMLNNITQFDYCDMPCYVKNILLSFKEYMIKLYTLFNSINIPKYMYCGGGELEKSKLGILGGMAGYGLMHILK